MSGLQHTSSAETVIEPPRGVHLGLGEVWQRRDLLFLLTQRQISSRYRQMFLGVLWAFLEPVAQLVVVTIVFGFLLDVGSEGQPYAVFAFAGIAPWLLFSRAALSSAGSLTDNIGLISKVYFPRLILPLASIGREIFDVMLLVLLLLALSIAHGIVPTGRVVLLPLILAYAALLALTCGLWLASLMVKFRDVRPVLALALQAGMYATPILYGASIVPERFRFVYELNPMYWVVTLSRWALLRTPVELSPAFWTSLAASVLLFLGGLIAFSTYERMTVDVQ